MCQRGLEHEWLLQSGKRLDTGVWDVSITVQLLHEGSGRIGLRKDTELMS